LPFSCHTPSQHDPSNELLNTERLNVCMCLVKVSTAVHPRKALPAHNNGWNNVLGGKSPGLNLSN
jgi:hypothetical protein